VAVFDGHIVSKRAAEELGGKLYCNMQQLGVLLCPTGPALVTAVTG